MFFMVKQKYLNENNRDRFKRIAESRANRVLDNLRLLGNCSNERLYSFSDSDIKKIFYAIETEVRRTKNMFNKKKKRKIKL